MISRCVTHRVEVETCETVIVTREQLNTKVRTIEGLRNKGTKICTTLAVGLKRFDSGLNS